MDKITEENDFDIRYSQESDFLDLPRWLDQPKIRRWYPISKKKDLQGFAKNWMNFSKYKASLTATNKEEIVGIATLFLMPYKKVSHHSSLYFIVHPNYYNRGIGTSLLRNIFHLGTTYFRLEKIHIEVYAGCPAISIIEKGKFDMVFRQEHFVKEENGNYLARIIYEKACNGK